MKIAFIGLGNIGLPLARNLHRAGHDLVVTDLDRQRADALIADGAKFAATADEAVADVDIAITSLPNPQAVAAVVSGPQGILSGLRPGALWIEMSTTDARAMQEYGEAVRSRGIDVLEAPITGGCHRAHTGEISILVGGDEGVFERYRPIIEIMGGEVLHIGPVGSASVVKVITNMLAFIHLWGAGEALMLAKRCGVDLTKAFHGIRMSSGNSFVHETESQVILNGSYNIGFTMDLALKDLALTLALADETETPLEMARFVNTIFERAREAYGGRAWSTEVVRLLEDELGEQLRAPGFPEVLPGMESAVNASDSS
ncbi:MAG: NAD(P)-dependent oxidoreductase [Alphaproteobacteria bacterium]|nr:NAD(P)-dependent oxidoreductase [Alphaproteobacteria bacterium]